MEITLVKVVDPAKADEFFGPDKGNRFVAVQLRLTNVGTLNYDDSPSNGAALIDVDDQQYTSAIFDSAAGAPLGSPKIAVGASRLGFITFEIPKGIELALFQFTLDSGFGPETGEWIVGVLESVAIVTAFSTRDTRGMKEGSASVGVTSPSRGSGSD